MRKLSILVNCMFIILFFLGCDEDSIVNNYIVNEATIAGRVLPESSNSTVALWMGTEVVSGKTDSRGYFTFKEVEPGLYEVRITASSGASTRRFNVIAESGKTTNLGEIILSKVVWPILWVKPDDSLVAVEPSKIVVRFGSYEKIDMSSLEGAITLNPQVSGVWEEVEMYEAYEYRLVAENEIPINEEFTIQFNANLKFINGDSLGNSFSIQFSTQEFSIINHYWETYNWTNLSTLFRGELISVYFNAPIDTSTLASGVLISPSIDYSIDISNDRKSITIYVVDSLYSGTDYDLIINDELHSEGGAAISNLSEYSFNVMPFEIDQANLISNPNSVEPLTEYYLLRLYFTQNIDMSSLDNITIFPEIDITVSGYYSSTSIYVKNDEPLLPGTTYELTVGAGLRAVDGVELGESKKYYFTVQKLTITDFGFQDGYYSQLIESVDPEDANNYPLKIRFNTRIDTDSLNSACTFNFPLDGFWLPQYTYYGSYTNFGLCWFFETSPTVYAPSTEYTLTIASDVALVDDVTLDSTITLSFKTNSLRVESISPAHGSSNYSVWTDVVIDFNTAMDETSCENAFSLTTYDGTPIIGTFTWASGNVMRFNPTNQLTYGQVYRAVLSTSAQSLSGHQLGEKVESVFVIE